MNNFWRTVLVVLLLWGQGREVEAQLRRPGYITIDRENRTESRLMKETGAIYLEDVLDEEVKIKIAQAAPAYTNLNGQTWIGNVLANQQGVLLAVSDRAYRVRAQAAQGQIAGWISKSVVEGLPPAFEENLKQFAERHQVVKELIKNKQIALGMLGDEVIASLGPPDTRQSRLNSEGTSEILEYISYTRVPQQVMTYDVYRRPVPVTQYVEVESGRITVELEDDLVTAISESEGVDFSKNLPRISVPPPVYLY